MRLFGRLQSKFAVRPNLVRVPSSQRHKINRLLAAEMDGGRKGAVVEGTLELGLRELRSAAQRSTSK